MARPLSRPGLGTTTRRELCWWLAQGFSKEEAAKRAGLPDTYRIYQFTRTTVFADELRDALRDHLGTNLAPKAVRILDEIMSDTKVNARVRVDAAKALLDRAGFSVGEEAPKKLVDLDESSLSIDELQKIVERLKCDIAAEENRRAEGATVIGRGAAEEMAAFMT